MKSRQGMITGTGTRTTKAANMSNGKVTPEHLARNAYLYLRQSTMKQVLENQESTRRQYALKEKAIELGWDDDHIVVIDSDKGQSGQSAQDREGFKQLVSEVSLGLAGIVIGLEVSRLSRNSADWYHLMEICELRNTLILDEDGLYDLCNINDRLVMGFKGTISEFESHQIKNRLWGGKLFKARRGELHTTLPIGFVYNPSGQVELEPDQQVRQSLDLFFSTFRRLGSGIEVVRYFNKNSLKFPRYVQGGPDKGKIEWGLLNICRARYILKNPRYAGVFFYGKTQKKRFVGVGGGVVVRKSIDRDRWYSLIKGSHPGYITWEEYEENLTKLLSNSFGYNPHGLNNQSHRLPGSGSGPVREGSALLQGLAICGICGRKMNVHYHNRKKRRIPDYVCVKGHRYGEKGCQRIGGIAIDAAIGELLMASMTPLSLEVAINVEKELISRFEEADRIRRQELERLNYDVEQACNRYMNVDPGNRLVAATLEREWNDKLKQLEQAGQEYELQRQNQQKVLKPEEMETVMGLASDFHRLWEHKEVSHRDRKRMARLLIQDVALKKEKIAEADDDGHNGNGYGYFTSAKIRFRGGMIKFLNIPGPKKIWKKQKTSQEIVDEIDQLLDDQTYSEIAATLNKNGHLSPTGKPFTPGIIDNIRRHYHLKSRYQRLREKGPLTLKELSDKIKIPMKAIRELEKRKMINLYKCTDKRKRLYELPGNDFIKILHSLKGKRGFPGDFIDKFSEILKEVHYEE
jgi:DNA invertase Pin-like site-specific DNA recombinase